MKHTIQQVFHSGKFLVGFSILVTLLLFVFIYPLIIKDAPLGIIGQGTFFPPGVYVSAFDSINSPTTYTLNLDNASANRIDSKLDTQARQDIKDWLVADKIPAEVIGSKRQYTHVLNLADIHIISLVDDAGLLQATGCRVLGCNDRPPG